MPDLFVKLYTLSELEPVIAAQKASGIDIRRGLPPEKHVIVNWIHSQESHRVPKSRTIAECARRAG